MATPIVFSPVLTWVDAADPNNIPPGFKIIMAADLLRYENWGKDGAARINSVESTVEGHTTSIGTLNTWKGTTDTDITNLKKLPALATKTANYTIVAADSIIIGNGTSITVTLPSAVTMTAGKTFRIKNRNSTTLTVGSTAGTIDGAATKTLAQWASADFASDGANWYVL